MSRFSPSNSKQLNSVNAQLADIALNVKSNGVKGDGVTDDAAVLQTILNSGGNILFPSGTYLLGTGLTFTSNTRLYMQKGVIFKFKPNMPAWSRIFTLSGISNVQIYGHFEMNGQADTVTNGNEQMSNLFIYNCMDIYIQSVHSYNSFGDNVFVGGTEANPSFNVVFDVIKGEKAGRKNLVVHYVDRLHIGTCILDNTQGGAPYVPNGTYNWDGFECVDVEPDSFGGTVRFRQRIDYLYCNGEGLNFAVGTGDSQAKMWTIDIGTLDCVRMPTVAAHNNPTVLNSFGVTCHIDKLNVISPASDNNVGLFLEYASYFTINEAYFENGADYAIEATAQTAGTPSLKIGKLKMNNRGKGVEVYGANVEIEGIEANNITNDVLYSYATANHSVYIGEIVSVNSGSNAVVELATYQTNVGYVRINSIKVFDTRTTTASAILEIWNDASAEYLVLGSIHNANSINELTFTSGVTVKAIKLSGGTLLPAFYMCQGTPQGMLPAPVGSLATRMDGGTSTTFYVKESGGTTNTGWVAK